LEKYLRQVSGGTAVLLRRNQYQPEANTLWVGCLDKFPGLEGPKVQDPQRDDAIVIKVDNRQGIIAGANPRATLIAVYRYLTELGCRWVRPGADGELIIADSDPLARNV